MTLTPQPPILIYTTPTCPDCKLLKEWLVKEQLSFEERDLTDPQIMAEAKARTGVRVAPITLIGEHIFYGTFSSQKPSIMAILKQATTKN
ncbi:glutaredoxin family protein [Providencia vermicola]|uniref:Glutaredoxin family protein n=1 Tax=Providencia vermicola TaxID=333965 RepID=A0AAX3RXP2_9GAMM|nr:MULTISPECIES: glutaredoxin family protein [Providencia]ELX8377961.1 glutaredoxin family protein [Providencia stuartii]EMD5257502.1 glutaredoxin family protein [Providencia stuartii]QIC17369.1 glutaredoxin family protein [Providencia vermicola]USB37471.1 glutaredoxin family protein [Providencia vermicola]WBA57441.1 glutaredoxin family protein [Providencia sp. 21OH12SH02B-Prov]